MNVWPGSGPLSVTLSTGQCVPCSYLAAASVELTSCAPHWRVPRPLWDNRPRSGGTVGGPGMENILREYKKCFIVLSISDRSQSRWIYPALACHDLDPEYISIFVQSPESSLPRIPFVCIRAASRMTDDSLLTWCVMAAGSWGWSPDWSPVVLGSVMGWGSAISLRASDRARSLERELRVWLPTAEVGPRLSYTRSGEEDSRTPGLRSLAPAPTQRTTARAQTRAGVTRGAAGAACVAAEAGGERE